MDAASTLRRARSDAGLTQTELAERLGVTQPTIAALERPGSNPRVRTLERALEAMGIELTPSRRATSAVDETQIADRLRLTPAARLTLFARSQTNLRSLVAGARRVPR